MGNNGDGGIGVMDEEMLKKCKQVLTKLMKHKMSWVFKAPVDVVGLGLHDYHQIIKRPMDLGTVKSNLSKGFYSNVGDFAADVRLVFENAMLYNPRTDDVHGMADQMLRIFEDLFRPIQAKLAKSNDRGNGNERVGNVHGMGNNVRVFDMANERVVNVNDMVNDVVNEVNRVNEFSAVDELDGSSWDDVQTPERTKKAKSEAKSSGFPVASKQIHSTASNAVNAVIPPVVHSPVRMPSRTPSPMQVTEPVKPSNTSTMTKTVFPKLPKPRAKDPNKREMNMEEKQKLGLGLQSMPPEKMPQLLQIIRKRNDQLAQEGDEIELDIEALDTETLWELDRFVTNWKKFVSKTKRQALMVNSASAVAAPSVSADIDDVPMSEKMDGVKKSKKDAGEEDVDIGDEMPESSFPHVEIEKDDGGGGQGQAVTGGGQGNNDNNASSSSSGSSSSSSSGSSSSSDSDSGSSSGSDSDADDAQS
ncbi:bromodomain, NET domain protein [Artemisia annua]|nr:bromodomain, NET domain protein [Artemisia annua]